MTEPNAEEFNAKLKELAGRDEVSADELLNEMQVDCEKDPHNPYLEQFAELDARCKAGDLPEEWGKAWNVSVFEILNDKRHRIADLEAKLAAAEKERDEAFTLLREVQQKLTYADNYTGPFDLSKRIKKLLATTADSEVSDE